MRVAPSDRERRGGADGRTLAARSLLPICKPKNAPSHQPEKSAKQTIISKTNTSLSHHITIPPHTLTVCPVM
jgi:hypothetical protein